MNPYKRFHLISNSLAVALVALGVGLSTFAGGPTERLAGSLFGVDNDGALSNPLIAVLMIGLVVLVWLSLSQFVLPRMFGFDWVRRLVLGRYYFEGTWIKAVRLAKDGKALAVMDVQPMDERFVVTGRFINERGEVISNFRTEYQALEWPVLKLKHVHNRPTQDSGARDGVSEIMFEANRERPRRFDGCFLEGAHAGALVEGARLDDRDARRLRIPGERAGVLREYWAEFFAPDINLARPNDEGGLDRGAPLTRATSVKTPKKTVPPAVVGP